MSILNSDTIKTILKPFKEKLDNLVDKDNASVNNTISINNNDNDTIATLSADQKSVKLSIGNNTMALNTDGELLVNNVNVLSNNNNDDGILVISKKSVADTYAKNKDIPYDFEDGTAVAIGNNVYLLGGTSSTNYNYKYNTLTNTYTKNKDIPYSFSHGSAVVIGTDIYLLFATNNYKYNTLTNTYTKNKDIPYKFTDGSAVAVGTDIYLLGGLHYNNTNYKYDTITNTYVQNTDIPYDSLYGSAVGIGTNIYLLGGIPINTNNYKYDTITKTYTQNRNIPYGFRNGSAVAIGTNIYILGVGASYNYKYTIPHNEITILKKSNYYIYTESKSYGPEACIVVIGYNEYYTEYNGNSIIKSTVPVLPNGTTKMYIKPGAILYGNKIPCKTKGWQTINILKYI